VSDLPSEAQEEPEQAQKHIKDRSECSSRNRKRSRTCLAESGRMDAGTNQRGAAAGSCNPSLVNGSARIVASDPGPEVVQDEEATTLCEIPSGWARVKLEPDC
jgi:hypothetical protein